MVTQIIGRERPKGQGFSREPAAAKGLDTTQRRTLSLEALAGTAPIADLARQHDVSRKFVYRQAAKASDALERAFAAEGQDDQVLLHLSITKAWIRQFVLELTLLCHSPFRGITEVLGDLFGHHMSIGTVHNIVAAAVEKARRVNNDQDLSAVRVGAHDEIFQARRPVLVGMDVASTYCYLLAAEDHRDETTWGVHLLELAEQGLCPDYTVADEGKGLRAGQKAAWGTEIACHADVFHVERALEKLACFLANRASGCTAARQKLERKMDRAKKRGKGKRFSGKLGWARDAERKAVPLAQDIRILTNWIKQDILSLAGPNRKTRGKLFDFVVAELRQREALCVHRIQKVRTLLEQNRDDLLAFADVLDERFGKLAERSGIPVHLIHEICQLQGMDQAVTAYWQEEARLRQKLRGRFHDVQCAVRKIMAETPRASSIVENLNSRLRNYFFLRHQIGNGYLNLLRFFLNHHRYQRSRHPERVGKSPVELLTGVPQPHWLEVLGYPLPVWN